MSRNLKYKIFYEKDLDKKLTTLLAVKKYKPTYSELLKKVNMNAKELKPVLNELQEKNYIAISHEKRFVLPSPIPSPDEIKIYKYILKYSPTHSRLLKALNGIIARRVKSILGKLQKEGLLNYDLKRQIYHIPTQQNDVINIIIDSINSEREIEKFIDRYRDIQEKQYDDSKAAFLSAFFDFDLLYEKKIDLFTYLVSKNYHSLSQVLNDTEILIGEIIDKSKGNSPLFWRNLENYLYPPNSSISNLMAEEVKLMDEEFIQKKIEALPPYFSSDDFIDSLEKGLFGGYRNLLTPETSYTRETTIYHNETILSPLGKVLFIYYVKKYPEKIVAESFREAVDKYVNYFLLNRNNSEYGFHKIISKEEYSQKHCFSIVLNEFKQSLKAKEIDYDLLINSLDRRYVYAGTVSKNMHRAIHYLATSEYQENDIRYIEMLRQFFGENWKELEADELWSDNDTTPS